MFTKYRIWTLAPSWPKCNTEWYLHRQKLVKTVTAILDLLYFRQHQRLWSALTADFSYLIFIEFRFVFAFVIIINNGHYEERFKCNVPSFYFLIPSEMTDSLSAELLNFMYLLVKGPLHLKWFCNGYCLSNTLLFVNIWVLNTYHWERKLKQKMNSNCLSRILNQTL